VDEDRVISFEVDPVIDRRTRTPEEKPPRKKAKERGLT
jgi:hypothetical protein